MGKEIAIEEVGIDFDQHIEETRQRRCILGPGEDPGAARRDAGVEKLIALVEVEERSLLDYLSNENDLSPEEEALRFTLKEDIETALDRLNQREGDVLRLYFGLDQEPSLTLDQIGARFKLTRERVRQIKEIALSKLRHPRFYAKLRAFAEA